MSMTEVVEESLKADARFRHLTVKPMNQCDGCMAGMPKDGHIHMGGDFHGIHMTCQENKYDRRRQDQA